MSQRTSTGTGRRSHRLLDADEERHLADRVQRGMAAAAELAGIGDDDSRRGPLTATVEAGRAATATFVECNQRLVVALARRFSTPATFDDAVQEGNLGLLRAVERFDPALGYRFSTHATWWVRQAILRHHSDLIRLPYQVRHARRIWVREGAAAVEDVADRTGLQAGLLARAVEAGAVVASLDAPAGGDDPGTFGDRVPADGPAVDGRAVDAVEAERVRVAMAGLSDRDRAAVTARFGLDGSEPATYEQVGVLLGMSHQGAKNVIVRALRRLESRLAGSPPRSPEAPPVGSSPGPPPRAARPPRRPWAA